MYVPPQFREERPEVLRDAVRSIRFAALVTPAPDGLQVSHLPMLLRLAEDGAWTLEAHVARPNPHWTHCGEEILSAAVFQGPQAYITPTWYQSKRMHGKVVPTWNYIAIHAHGVLEAIEDEDWLLTHVSALTELNEAGRAEPWAVSDAPAEYVRGMTRAIVGLRLSVTRVEASWKMAQHRSEADRLGAISGLETESDSHGHAVAGVMRALEAISKPAE